MRSILSLLRFVSICTLLRLRGVNFIWTRTTCIRTTAATSGFTGLLGACDRYQRPDPGARPDRRVDHPVGVRDPIQAGSYLFRMATGSAALPTIRLVNRLDRHSAPADSRVALFFGLCKPYKGLESLIDAVASSPPGTILVIAGKFQSLDYQRVITSKAQQVSGGRVLVRPATFRTRTFSSS